MADVVAAMVRLGPASLTALAEAAGCTRANTFRILHTLQTRGLAAQIGKRGGWQLGTAWLSVARAAIGHGLIEATALPLLETLARRCGEPVYLAIRDGEQSVVVAAQAGGPAARLFAHVGERAPLHAGPGRLLLACAPDAVQRAVLGSRLSRLASATRTDPSRISADLPGIRARNWLITKDEIADGMVSVSAAVLDGAGEVVAVLSIIAPALRLPPPRPHTLLTPLLDTAKQLGGLLYQTTSAPTPSRGDAAEYRSAAASKSGIAVHGTLSRPRNK